MLRKIKTHLIQKNKTDSDTLTECYYSPDCRSHHEYAVMMNILDINKDIEYFKEELSIENIILSIRKLKEQVKKLETKRVCDVARTDNI